MKEQIEEIFGEAYLIDSLQKDGIVLVRKESLNPSGIYVGWTNSFESLKFDAVVGLVRFNTVEDLLDPILKKFGISYTSYGNWASTLNSFVRVDQEVKKNDKQDLNQALRFIKEKVIEIEGSFFNPLSTLGKVSKYLSSLNEDQLSEKVTNPVLIRKFVIDSLAGNIKDYKLHCDSIVNEYIEAEKIYPHIFKNHDKASQEVLEVLS